MHDPDSSVWAGRDDSFDRYRPSVFARTSTLVTTLSRTRLSDSCGRSSLPRCSTCGHVSPAFREVVVDALTRDEGPQRHPSTLDLLAADLSESIATGRAAAITGV